MYRHLSSIVLPIVFPIVFQAILTSQSAPIILETDPGVTGRVSALWALEVHNGTNWVRSAVHQYTRQSNDPHYHQGNHPWVHFSTIGINTSTKVRFTRLTRPWGQNFLNSATVYPSRHGITPNVDTTLKTIEFKIHVGQKVYIETNSQDHDTLFLFANPLKPAINPTSLPPNVDYFGPGIHTIGMGYAPTGKDTIYIDAGAWVIGTIDVTQVPAGSTQFKILGPGVLSGQFTTWEFVKNNIPSFSAKVPYFMIHSTLNPPATPTHDILVDGITILASPYFNLEIRSVTGEKIIRNVHILTPWTYNTDGFSLGSDASIHDCLVFNNDDTIHSEYVNKGSIHVRDNVLVGRNCFLAGYGYFAKGKVATAHMYRNDCVMQGNRIPFRARVDADPTNGVVVENQVYKDIRIDSDVNRLFHLNIEDTGWGYQSPTGGTWGNLAGIVFENIELLGTQSSLSQINGIDAANTVGSPERPIIFRNVRINGVKLTLANHATYMQVNQFVHLSFQ